MSEGWSRVEALFAAAVALPLAERAAFIASSDAPDEVRNEVLSLLASHDEAGDFLEKPPPDESPEVETPTAETEAEPPLLPEGVLIGQYRIGPLLGAGGMGVVYEAYDTRLHRRVAVKSLSPRFSREARQRERLKQEARAAAALTHPGIATVYALEEFDSQLFIVSEYLDGETLRLILERRRMPVETAVATGLEIARAMAAAHERGIVHRDLKPENIICTSGGALKILDFGLAQFEGPARDLVSMSRITQPGLVAGTPPYMAPEQLLGRPTDVRTDQFAFGVVLYELCTGRHPFGGGSLPSTIARILAGDPAPLTPDDEIPPNVWRIVDRCLQKDPGARFDTTRELVTALESLSGTAALTAPAALEAPAVPAALEAPAASASARAARQASYGETSPERPDGREGVPGLWWWRFHQFAAAMAYWFMVWPVWHVHRSWGRAGLFFFFATLAAVVVAANLRLHLFFSSRVHPENLAEQRADEARWIRAADIAFAVLLIIGGIALPEDRAGWAALFISFGIGSALAALFIEPSTARAAFK